MASAISTSLAVTVVYPTVSRTSSQAGQTPTTARTGNATAQAAPATTPNLTANPLAGATQVQAQLEASNLGPEGRLMKLLRAMIPPVPPPLIPPTNNIQA